MRDLHGFPRGAAVVIRNVGARPISSVTFGIVGYDEGDPGHRLLLRETVSGLSIQPGASLNHAANLLPHEQHGEQTSQFAGAPRFQLGVLGVTFADGTSWTYELPEEALVFTPNSPSMRGVPRAEVTRTVPSTGDPEATCLDDKRKKFWHGEVSPVAGEPLQFARCVYGRWVDYALVREFKR